MEEFEAAIRLKPGWCEAHFGLGTTLYELHDQAGASKELRETGGLRSFECRGAPLSRACLF